MTPWNQHLINRLIALWNDGASASSIASELGVSRDAVTSKARRLKLKGRGSPIISNQAMMDTFAEALAEGASISDAGKFAGIGPEKGNEICRNICNGLGYQAA